MIKIGLTGSIAMGKSFVASILQQQHIPVFDADAVVHTLYQDPNVIERIKIFSPDSVVGGKLDRKILSRSAFENKEILQELEHLLHPKVRQARKRFLQEAHKVKTPIIAYDIPLLLEQKKHYPCDVIWVVSSSGMMQHRRALTREGMTEEKFHSIKHKQMSDQKKRLLADTIIYTGFRKAHTMRYVLSALAELKKGIHS